jgi:phosphoribosylanthranilate isomerase
VLPLHADGASIRVKICGVTRAEDAHQAEVAGADYVGVVLSTGFGRSVDPAAAARLLDGTRVERVAVLVDEPLSRAVEAAATFGAGTLQLHGSEGRETVARLRDAGDWRIWKAVRARTVDDLTRAVRDVGDLVDGFLVEGWRAGAVGGAGLRLELDPGVIGAALPADRTFVLAGGLTAETVSAAVARFRPHVVDVSSGVERDHGVKDHARIEAFVRAARDGAAPLRPT